MHSCFLSVKVKTLSLQVRIAKVLNQTLICDSPKIGKTNGKRDDDMTVRNEMGLVCSVTKRNVHVPSALTNFQRLDHTNLPLYFCARLKHFFFTKRHLPSIFLLFINSYAHNTLATYIFECSFTRRLWSMLCLFSVDTNTSSTFGTCPLRA